MRKLDIAIAEVLGYEVDGDWIKKLEKNKEWTIFNRENLPKILHRWKRNAGTRC